jgi:protein-S-isoprenylcysteine O-methyltransferase Ste14
MFVGFLIVLLFISESKWEAREDIVCAILFLAGCVLVGIASLGRLWCSLYIAGYKTDHLITLGPYSVSRNPLYFFSLLGGLGVGLATETFTVPMLILIMFALYYPFVIRHEENKLRNIYGDQYEAYFRSVPQFWPKWSLLEEPNEYVVTPKVFRRHMYSALWFIWIVGILELLETLRELDPFSSFFHLLRSSDDKVNVITKSR